MMRRFFFIALVVSLALASASATDKLAGGIKAGSTSVSLPVELRKSSDSTALTGIVYTGVTARYWRQGGTSTSITTATLGSVNAAYSSGGFVEVDATNMPGVYRFDVPDAAFATGADWVVVSLKVSTAFQQSFMFALESSGAAENFARLGVPAGASVSADVAAVKTDTAAIKSKTDNLPAAPASTTNITAGTITTVTTLANLPSIPSNWLTAAGIASGALNGKGDWNVGKTGYSLTQSFPTNFSSLAITAGGLVDLNDKSGFSLSVAPPTAVEIRSELDSNSTRLANLDAAVSTRSTYAGNDTSGTTTLLSRVGSALTITGGKVDVNDKTGFSLISAYDPARVDPLGVILPSTYTGQQAGHLIWRVGNKP